MEADTAFVRTNCIVVLHTVTHVCLHVTFVVYPSNSELVYSVGYAQTLNQIRFVKLRVLVVLFFDGSQNFFYCLVVLWFVRKTKLQSV
ncbi:hypothetical protein SDC9_110759 [bioreactor metagenome]|uniref:Uncharacterized protein n=1 Tax=bioreactor metagenome TaxID=1076179 RepID=A0A645BEJ9_9ZZZZ